MGRFPSSVSPYTLADEVPLFLILPRSGFVQPLAQADRRGSVSLQPTTAGGRLLDAALSANRMIVFRAIIISLIITLGGMDSVSAASFDCSKASTAQEKLICSDNSLGVLDDQLAQIYKERITHSKEAEAEKQRQIRWLVDVRGKCSSKDCLREAYTRRMATLKTQAMEESTCPVQETDLVGAWVRRSGSGFFEKMAFGMNGAERDFNSWLDHRPEFSGGSWTFKDCEIDIKHQTEAQLGVVFVVIGYRNEQLHVTENGEKGESIYRKVGK